MSSLIKEDLTKLNELLKAVDRRIAFTAAGVSDILAALGRVAADLAELERRNSSAAIMDRLVQRGTITAAERDAALQEDKVA
jgi:hypothetical protein